MWFGSERSENVPAEAGSIVMWGRSQSKCCKKKNRAEKPLHQRMRGSL